MEKQHEKNGRDHNHSGKDDFLVLIHVGQYW